MMVKLRKNFLKILSACLLLVAMLGCSSSKDEDVSDYIQGKFDLNNPITSVDSTPDDFENDDDSILTLKEKDPNDVEQEDNLDCWIGEYLLEESDNCGRDDGYFISMVTSIEIYKEDGEYYAEINQNGHNCWITNKALVYGDSEWISLVMDESLEENSYFSDLRDTVFLSLRNDGENIYSYWNFANPLLPDNESSEKVTVTKKDYEPWEAIESDVDSWLGEYEYRNPETLDNFRLFIYEKENKDYADLIINDNDIFTCEIYGNEEWLSIVCIDPPEKSEETRNKVLVNFKRDKSGLQTLWGNDNFVKMITDNEMNYYGQTSFFTQN